MKRRDVDHGQKHAIEAACYSLRPEYGRHVPCLICACGKSFHGESWEEAGAEYDEHLDGEDDAAPPPVKAIRGRRRA